LPFAHLQGPDGTSIVGSAVVTLGGRLDVADSAFEGNVADALGTIYLEAAYTGGLNATLERVSFTGGCVRLVTSNP